jgi:hypothetical protein
MLDYMVKTEKPELVRASLKKRGSFEVMSYFIKSPAAQLYLVQSPFVDRVHGESKLGGNKTKF